MPPAEISPVEFVLARVRRELDCLDPETRQREIVRIRLQILRNALRLVGGLSVEARAVLLEQVDDLAACVNVRLAGGAR